MKRCAKCREVKDLDGFGVSSQSRDGRSSYCRPCYREMHARYRRDKAQREGRVANQRRPRIPGQKWCPDCGEYKPVEDFGRNRSTGDGLTNYCRPCHARRGKQSKERLHGGSRHYHLVRRYGLSAADVDALIEAQGGRCPVCRRELDDKAHVDHDHKTGGVRGVLCFNCNGGLGQFGDDPMRLHRARLYLEARIPERAIEANLELLLLDRGLTAEVWSLPRPGKALMEYPAEHVGLS